MIAVVDYGIGNLRSAEKAMQHVGADASLVSDPADLGTARGVVLPGVGSFGRCAEALTVGGWRGPLLEVIEGGTPFLGICIGFQLLYGASDESPGAFGLGVLPGSVHRLPAGPKHPQMQWNHVRTLAPNDLLPADGSDPWMYFVHSYAPGVGPETIATCDYGGPIAVAVQREHLFGVQFHPEKSGADGLALLRRFTDLVATT